jgi:hypothetical protein
MLSTVHFNISVFKMIDFGWIGVLLWYSIGFSHDSSSIVSSNLQPLSSTCSLPLSLLSPLTVCLLVYHSTYLLRNK